MTENRSSGVAVVTGASRGIGAAIAHRLAREGLAVACGATTAANAEYVAAAIRAEHGVDAIALALQVSDAESVEAAMTAIEDRLGPVTLLVGNAGVAHVESFLHMAVADFDRVLDVNLRGVFVCGQAAARHMVASGTRGAIVNIGSIAGVNAFPQRAGYCASKAAVAHLTKVMALDLADHGIRVNCVAPGYIRTDMVQGVIDDGRLDEGQLRRRIPMHELGTVEDIAAAVAWMASDEARYATGVTLVIDGGWVAHGHV